MKHGFLRNVSDDNVRCMVCSNPFKPANSRQQLCSDECKDKWRELNKEHLTQVQYSYISGNWEKYFKRLLYNGNRRDDLTVDDLLEKLKEQEGRCALTGTELTCKLEKGTICKTNASIDRISAGGPYLPENIQLVCSAINKFRGNLTVEEFVWWCKKVTEFYTEK